jgi:hypothetical protein
MIASQSGMGVNQEDVDGGIHFPSHERPCKK